MSKINHYFHKLLEIFNLLNEKIQTQQSMIADKLIHYDEYTPDCF